MNINFVTFARILTATLGYLTSGPAMAWLFEARGSACSLQQLNTYCAFNSTPAFDPVVYALFAGATAAIMLFTRLAAHEEPWFPGVMLFGYLALGSLTYDSLFQRHVIADGRLINDTLNMLRFAMLASFTCFFIIARKLTLPPIGVILAVFVSFGALVGVGGIYEEISYSVIGVTRLFLLFVLYAFVGFAFHVMTIAVLMATAHIPESRP